MESDFSVKIHSDKSSETEYLIKDKSDIVIGRFIISELNGKSRTCDISLKFYRENDYILLSDTLNLILKAIFKDFPSSSAKTKKVSSFPWRFSPYNLH